MKLKTSLLSAAVLYVSVVQAATTVSTVRYSPDTTISLGGVVVSPQNEAEEIIASTTVSLLPVPAISGADVDGYAIASNGDHLISYDTAVALSGITFQPNDVIRYNGSIYSMEFDGSVRGLPDGTNVTDIATDGTALLLVVDTATLVGAITAGPEDVVRFDGNAFSLHFDGSAAGVPAGTAIDGVHLLPNTHLMLSFDITGTVGGVTFDDDDVLEFTAASSLWEMAYNGSVRIPEWDTADLRALSACGGAIISPLSNAVGGGGGSGTVVLTAGNGCSWTASSDSAFLTITSAAGGSGDTTLSYSVAANPACSPRQATLTIAGLPFVVTQSAGSGSFSISPASNAVAGEGGSGVVTVTGISGCGWTATSNDPFITVTAGSSGSGNGSVSYTVAVNPDCGTRSGSILIAGQVFMIHQIRGTGTFSLTPASDLAVEGGETGSFNVTATPGCAWTATTGDSFVTITGGSSGTGNGTVTYSVAANPSSPQRIGTIFVAGQTFTITQAGNTGLRGDANGDGVVTVADVFYLVNFLFVAGPAPVGVADANADNAVTVADVFYLVSYLFAGGPVPPPL